MYFLERACESQVHILAAGRRDVNAPRQGVAKRVKGKTPRASKLMLAERLAWRALLRKLDRIVPSYRK